MQQPTRFPSGMDSPAVHWRRFPGQVCGQEVISGKCAAGPGARHRLPVWFQNMAHHARNTPPGQVSSVEKDRVTKRANLSVWRPSGTDQDHVIFAGFTMPSGSMAASRRRFRANTQWCPFSVDLRLPESMACSPLPVAPRERAFSLTDAAKSRGGRRGWQTRSAGPRLRSIRSGSFLDRVPARPRRAGTGRGDTSDATELRSYAVPQQSGINTSAFFAHACLLVVVISADIYRNIEVAEIRVRASETA